MTYLPAILTLFGAILAALGVFWSAYNQAEAQREIREKDTKIIALSEEVHAKSEEILKLNEKMFAHVTGGRSYCYVMARTDSIEPDRLYFTVLHDGDTPVFDVKIQLTDLNMLGTLGPHPSVASAAKAMQVHSLGTVIHDIGWSVGPFDLKATETRRYQVQIFLRNGWVNQRIVLRKVRSEWKLATRIFLKLPDRMNEMIEKIDAGFPLDTAGKVEW